MKVLSLIIVLLFVVSCSNSVKQETNSKKNNKEESNNINSEVYFNDSLNVSFIKIQDWDIMENFHDVPVFCLSPLKNKQDFYQENITIISEDIHGYNLNEYYNNNLKGLQSFLTDFKIINEENWTNQNGHQFKKLIYTNNSQGYTFKVLVLFTSAKEKGYVVNCTALLNTFNEYLDDFNVITKSFKIKE